MKPWYRSIARGPLVKDADGRDLLLPWGRMSRTAIVLPTAAARTRVEQFLDRFTRGWLAAWIAFLLLAVFVDVPGWPILALVTAAAVHWEEGLRRNTSGFPRVLVERRAG